MTPQDKAYDIFKKVYEELGLNTDSIPIAKRISLLIVDEILQTNPTLQGTSDDLVTQIIQTKAYWYQVQNALITM